MTQPKPKKNNDTPIGNLVIEDIKDRMELGLKNYGIFLQANNGRDALQDFYEEYLDGLLYLKQFMREVQLEKLAKEKRKNKK